MDYKLIRSARKTVGIYITKNGEVEVRAPFSVRQKTIDGFVTEKETWIIKSLSRVESRNNERESYDIARGLYCLGTKYPVVFIKDLKEASFENGIFYLPEHGTAREWAEKWYKAHAREWIPERVNYISQKIGIKFGDIKINSAATRWGSCNAKGNLNFTWKLLLVRYELIDYIIVHELAHIRELNHSARFWSLVGSIMPDYKVRKKALCNILKEGYIAYWN